MSFLHSGGLKTDPLFKGTKGNEYNMGDLKPFFEVADSDGGLFVGARRNAEEDTLLLAHHPVGDAVLHDGAAARRSPCARPLLDTDRRRELLDVLLRLPPGARR